MHNDNIILYDDEDAQECTTKYDVDNTVNDNDTQRRYMTTRDNAR